MPAPNQTAPYVRPIIGFAGRMHSGKTTAAIQLYSYGFVRVRFAGPLKAMLHALGLTPAQLDGDQKEQPCELLGGVTPRQAMRTLGTEWGRQCIGSDLWVNAWKHAVNKHKETQPVVADDVRFQNEVDAIRTLGGIVVQVDRPDALKHLTGHASEVIHLDGIDHVIRNSGPIEQFREQIRHLAKGLVTTITDAKQPRAA